MKTNQLLFEFIQAELSKSKLASSHYQHQSLLFPTFMLFTHKTGELKRRITGALT